MTLPQPAGRIAPMAPRKRGAPSKSAASPQDQRKKSSAEQDESPVVSVEEALERLEGLVEALEEGELPLEESLSLFEEGVSLTRNCAEQLKGAERRIEVLMQEGGEWLSRSFGVADDSEEL